MIEEYIIGRSANSPVKVPADRHGVSSQHLKITVYDNGYLLLEDLNSANGTYIRDENGNFHRIYKKQIHESDVIRLGPGGANSFTFMARRVISPNSNYEYEFRQLRRTLHMFKEEELEKEKRMEMNAWISRSAGLLVIALITILGTIGGFEIPPESRYYLIAGAPIIVGLLFKGDRKGLRELRERRSRMMLCPCCGKPISEFDVEEGQCSRCKAK